MEKLYEIIVNERHRDYQRRWVIFGLMSAINGGLLAAINFGSLKMPGLQLISVLGIVLCIIWFILIYQLAFWGNKWEALLVDIEPFFLDWVRDINNSQINLPQDFKVFVDRKKSAPKYSLSTTIAAQILPCLFLFAWIIIGFISPLWFLPETKCSSATSAKAESSITLPESPSKLIPHRKP